jgi:hypothetical protein
MEEFLLLDHGFKNRAGEGTGKGSGSRITGRTGESTGDVINNLINKFKILKLCK